MLCVERRSHLIAFFYPLSKQALGNRATSTQRQNVVVKRQLLQLDLCFVIAVAWMLWRSLIQHCSGAHRVCIHIDRAACFLVLGDVLHKVSHIAGSKQVASAAALREVGLQILGFEVLVDYGNAFPVSAAITASLRALEASVWVSC